MARAKCDITSSSFFYLTDTLAHYAWSEGYGEDTDVLAVLAVQHVRSMLNAEDMEGVESLRKDCEAYDRKRSGYVPGKRGRKPLVDTAQIAAETLAKFGETSATFARLGEGTARKVALASRIASAIAVAKATAKSAKLDEMLEIVEVAAE
jgi:hypothetical protein